MNKNKKNKLTIKDNWTKGLTISDKKMNAIRGGDVSLLSDCPLCICPPLLKETDGKPQPDPDPDPNNDNKQ